MVFSFKLSLDFFIFLTQNELKKRLSTITIMLNGFSYLH